VAAGALLLLAGCQHYDLAVVIEPDGSGQRNVEFSVDSGGDDEFPLTATDLQQFFGIDAAHGWQRLLGNAPDSTSVAGATFRRESSFSDLEDWARADGDLRIQAAPTGRPHADVVFTNVPAVRFLESEEGRICEYREIFTWRGLRQQITTYMGEIFAEQMAEAYPSLSSDDLQELHGLVAGMVMLHLQSAGHPEAEEPDDDLIEAAIVAHAEDVIRRHDPETSSAEVYEVVKAAADGPMNQMDKYLGEHLPGAYHAASTELNLSVTMPGRIVDSNADRVEGQTAIWEMSVWDASARPVEVFIVAEAEE
jgi:hypothetical protein